MMQTAEAVLSPQEERIEKGQAIGLISKEAQQKRRRIHAMLAGFRDRPIRLNLERALLLTESFKLTEGQPMVLRWGKAMAHILENISIHIDENELIAGSAGAPGRSPFFFRNWKNISFLRTSGPVPRAIRSRSPGKTSTSSTRSCGLTGRGGNTTAHI